ncbi:MAG: hypothetical protein H7233_02520 [Pseudorhodobacter sp.]|nr:hypothetical protein [Frankiaceae bacterium]
MLNLGDLDRWAGLLERAADEVRAARRRLEAAAAAVQWSSAAHDRFDTEVQEHLRRLGRSAGELDEAAEALRRHRVGADQAQHALGEALGTVLEAARGAAGQGVAAVTGAMDDARDAFADAARALLETADDGVDALGRLIRR